MNVNSKPINFIAVATTAAIFTAGAIAFAYPPEYSRPAAVVPDVQPAVTTIAAMHLATDTTGTAVVRLDGFTLDVSFDFERIDDSFGVPGSEFTNAEITNLAIDNVTDESGYKIPDFTDFNDHRAINQLLVAHMLQFKLLETV
ncbi:hypothetical protein [Acinetobacter sp. WCHAc010052]|uniref:hypothetical protein n=1 Tax=Acinetobacter sp. WCHAc010052 TaxID=2004647 RepID=UPI000B3C8043|nr:hypothetical protein [Acinetobacter sp. WCHAc010052]AXY60220.1 hypothetical protein CDG61_09395 [Acinetobacter sp. WCHAc010052]